MIASRNRISAVFGAVLILMGILLLVGQFIHVDLGGFLWPFLVIGFGALFFVGMVTGGRESGSLAIPGSVIVMIGLILLVQNLFGHWEGWAYSWGLILASVGAGLVIRGYWVGDEADRQRGWRLVRLGLVFFLVFGAFFELVIGFAGNDLFSRIFWPSALILVGLYLFVTRIFFANRSL